MRSRSAVSGRFVLAALLFFSLPNTEAVAQSGLTFVEPADTARTGINYDQAITVQWFVTDTAPFRGLVGLTTTLGTVSVPVMMTDDFGRATFIVRSGEPGNAILRAESATGATVDLQVRFEDPPPDALVGVPPHVPPFGEFSVTRVDENGVRYWLAKDRIAARVKPGLQITDIEAFIDDNDVIDRFPVGLGLMVFVFDESQRTKPLRELAIELEGLAPILQAGLFAKLDRSNQFLMVPDELIVRFESLPANAGDLDIFLDGFKDKYKLLDLQQFTTNSLRYRATVDSDNQPKDAIQLATDMKSDSDVANADPNFAAVMRPRSAAAGEPGFHLQWSHRNFGDPGTEDADIDTDRAWHFTEGSGDVVIAVIDSGFDINHPDLQENVDMAQLEDLADLDATDLLPEYYGFGPYMHGTNAAGVAAARGDNNRGYSGSCPQCTLVLIRQGHQPTPFQSVEAIAFAQTKGVDVLSNSWGVPGSDTSEEVWLTAGEAVDAGVTIVWAMTNENVDNCGSANEGEGSVDISGHPAVIAVSGITDHDERSPSYYQAKGHGICMDVLAPTRGGANGVHTTAVQMVDGEPMSTYWHNFGGTSAATPLVAGVIGLIKTLDVNLTPLEVQRILQDTADRVDPAHADYSAESGFSRPGGVPTHGYGRINAYEAVKLVAPKDAGDVDIPRGNEKMDLFLRDNVTDWGNTERPSNTKFNSPREQYNSYRSVDIKIDVGKDDPPVVTASEFSNFAGDTPQPGTAATVYVRVRNRGPEPVPNVAVKLHAAVADGTIPMLPDNFWTNYPIVPADTTVWQTFDTPLVTVPYSGASIAGCPRDVPSCHPDESVAETLTDPAVIVSFELPADFVWDNDSDQRLVLLAVVHHNDHDPVQGKLTGNSAFNFVPVAVDYDNNVTLWDPKSGGGGGGLGILWLFALLLITARNRHLVSRIHRR